jgi:hypothetical protein
VVSSGTGYGVTIRDLCLVANVHPEVLCSSVLEANVNIVNIAPHPQGGRQGGGRSPPLSSRKVWPGARAEALMVASRPPSPSRGLHHKGHNSHNCPNLSLLATLGVTFALRPMVTDRHPTFTDGLAVGRGTPSSQSQGWSTSAGVRCGARGGSMQPGCTPPSADGRADGRPSRPGRRPRTSFSPHPPVYTQRWQWRPSGRPRRVGVGATAVRADGVIVGQTAVAERLLVPKIHDLLGQFNGPDHGPQPRGMATAPTADRPKTAAP